MLNTTNLFLNITYVSYNFVYQCFCFLALIFANTYLNEFLIPDSLIWENGRLREELIGYTTFQALILAIEAGLLLFIIYIINKYFLFRVLKAKKAAFSANLTLGINLFVTLLAALIAFYFGRTN